MKNFLIIYIFAIFGLGYSFAQEAANNLNENIILTNSATSTAVIASTGIDILSGFDVRNIFIARETMQKMFFVTSGSDQIHGYVRKYLVSQLVTNRFNKFNKQPNYGSSSIYLKPPKTKTGSMNYEVTNKIIQSDSLDYFINNYINQHYSLTDAQKGDPSNFTDFMLPYITYNKWSNINLYKNQKDLTDLGYILTSYRTRINKDDSYRRFNISKAFYYFGNVRVINVGESVYFMDEINYDPKTQKNYKSGMAIVNDEEIPSYGGGLCGSSTAIYQGAFTNKGLIIRSRPHSKRWTNLYSANINGQIVAMPGLDSTVYSSKHDLVITNNTDHPIILVNSYDGKRGGQEQNFTIGQKSNIGSYKKGKAAAIKRTKKDTYKCYNRVINSKTKQSCYNEIDNKEIK